MKKCNSSCARTMFALPALVFLASVVAPASSFANQSYVFDMRPFPPLDTQTSQTFVSGEITVSGNTVVSGEFAFSIDSFDLTGMTFLPDVTFFGMDAGPMITGYTGVDAEGNFLSGFYDFSPQEIGVFPDGEQPGGGFFANAGPNGTDIWPTFFIDGFWEPVGDGGTTVSMLALSLSLLGIAAKRFKLA